ncbi:MAG: DnaJ domain-containing protein [Deltaproteobacteria bacterium]|nr:DnaJ domain-containing protein [Deltaproteobacteria bacterium]
MIELGTSTGGKIGPVYFSDLIGSALRNLFTGSMTFRLHGGDAVVYFKEGAPVLAGGSGLTNDRLGELLVTRRVCTKGTIDDVIQEQARSGSGTARPLLGEILVKKGVVRNTEIVEDCVKHQTTRRVTRMFGLTGGQWEAVPANDPMIKRAGIAIDAWPLLLPAIKAFATDEEIRDLTDQLLGKAVHLKAKPQVLERLNGDELDRELFRLIENPRKADQLERALKNRKAVRAALKAVLSTGIAELVPMKLAQPIKEVINLSAPSTAPVTAPGRPPPTASEPKPEPKKEAPKDDVPAGVRRHSVPPPPPSESTSASKPRDEGLRPIRRHEVPKEEIVRREAPRAAPAPKVSPIEKEIRAFHEKIGELNYFEMLGVPQSNADKDLRAAFTTLSKKYHPDALAGASPEVADIARAVQSKLNEAYAALSNADRRKEYLDALKAGKTQIDDQAEQKAKAAKVKYDMAMVMMKKKDFEKAKELLSVALNMDKGNAHYKGMMGWLTFSDPEGDRESAIALARGLLLESVAQQPADAEIQYYLGLVHKAAGDDDRALGAFKMALEADPDHLEASRELRLEEMRKKKEGESEGIGGKLSKLLKR